MAHRSESTPPHRPKTLARAVAHLTAALAFLAVMGSAARAHCPLEAPEGPRDNELFCGIYPDIAITSCGGQVEVGQAFDVNWDSIGAERIKSLGWEGPIHPDILPHVGEGYIGVPTGTWSGGFRLGGIGVASVELQAERGESESNSCYCAIEGVDTIPPVVIIGAPEDGFETDSNHVMLAVGATDLGGLKPYGNANLNTGMAWKTDGYNEGEFNAIPVSACHKGFGCIVQVPLQLGQNRITVRARDWTPNITDEDIFVFSTYDPGPLSCTITPDPAITSCGGQVEVGQAFDVAWESTGATTLLSEGWVGPIHPEIAPLVGAGQIGLSGSWRDGFRLGGVGEASVRLVASREDGSEESCACSVEGVDTTPPEIIIAAPADGAAVSEDHVRIIVAATDAGGLSNYPPESTSSPMGWKVNGGSLNVIPAADCGVFGCMADVPLLPNQENAIAVRTRDEAGHATERSITVVQQQSLGLVCNGPAQIRAGALFDIDWSVSGDASSVTATWSVGSTHQQVRFLDKDTKLVEWLETDHGLPKNGSWEDLVKFAGDLPSHVTITATGPNGTETCEHTVTIGNPDPVLTCDIDGPKDVLPGEPFTWTWTQPTGNTVLHTKALWVESSVDERVRARDSATGEIRQLEAYHTLPFSSSWVDLVKLRGDERSRVYIYPSNDNHVGRCSRRVRLSDESTCSYPGCYASGPLDFYPVPTCRRIDSTLGAGPLYSLTDPALPMTEFDFCHVPFDAKAVSITYTAVEPTHDAWGVHYPGDAAVHPSIATMSLQAGATRSYNTVVKLASDGSGTMKHQMRCPAGESMHYVIDVNGYYK